MIQTKRSERLWRRVMRASVGLVLGAGLAASTASAQATVPGHNGRITFVRYNPDVGDGAIYTAKPDGTDETEPYAGPAEGPRWSPDGKRISMACSGTPVHICTMKADGTDFVQLVPNDPTLNEGFGPWSPDGKLFAFEGWDNVNPDHAPGVFTMRSSDGGDLTRLTKNTSGGHDIPSDYSPDGSRIVFVRENPVRHHVALFLVNADGTHIQKLTPWILDAAYGSWSPDGTRIAFASHGFIFLMDPADPHNMQQIHAGTSPAWSPAGNRILFAQAADLYTMSPDGRRVRRVTNTPGVEEESPDWGTHRDV